MIAHGRNRRGRPSRGRFLIPGEACRPV